MISSIQFKGPLLWVLKAFIAILIISALTAFLYQTEFSKTLRSVNDTYRSLGAKSWAFQDGKKVDIGGEVTSIIGMADCQDGLGATFKCWPFSLERGDDQIVSLKNGLVEKWTTKYSLDGKVLLTRPNGFIVVGK